MSDFVSTFLGLIRREERFRVHASWCRSQAIGWAFTGPICFWSEYWGVGFVCFVVGLLCFLSMRDSERRAEQAADELEEMTAGGWDG